jgi:hypothetical protein
MYAVTRSYTGASALINAMEQRHEEVEQLISTVPGFVAYYAIRSGDAMTSVSVYDDRAGAEESTRRAAQWVRENLPDSGMNAPQVNSGEVFIELGAHAPAQGGGSARRR